MDSILPGGGTYGQPGLDSCRLQWDSTTIPIFYEIFRCGMKLMPSGCCSSVTLTGREDGDECRADLPPPISPCSRLNHKWKLDFYATIYRYCIDIDFHWILLTISSFISPSNKKHKQNLLNKRIKDVLLFLGFWAAVPQYKRFKS